MNKSNVTFAICLQCLLVFSFTGFAAGDEIDFKRDIEPILENRCWDCHGEDEQESGLRLDLRSNMLAGGDSGAATIVPGKPDESYLLEVINHVDEETAMPPDDDKLPQKEIDRLTQWVKEGAVWPGQMDVVQKKSSDHWSFQKVKRPAPPEANFVSPIDRFLSFKLREQGLGFSKASDPASLIRRVSIILTGIAPTPEQVTSFVKDFQSAPESTYEKLVDRLLDSPHFGERWAQHWLDVIRWAETNGSEANLYRKNSWIYRDYVVRSFNDDKPYDQFVREQIAGDSLGSGEATGFLVAGPHVPAATIGREPSAIRQARADRMDEIMQTVGASVMGITVGCARCHNHKFDPISIKDYYAMTAVFQDIEFGSRYPEFSEEHPQRKQGQIIWRQINAKRDELRKLGGWEENWGAYREWYLAPVKTRSIRFRFKQPNVSLDELEVFGPDDRQVNLVHQAEGVTLTGFPKVGGNNPISKINDGNFGTMAWRARVAKDAEQKPWVQFEFKEPQSINRIRMSSNREYFYDTDYLTQKPFLPRYEFDMDIMSQDGKWKPWIGTWFVNKKLNEKHAGRKKTLNEIQKLIGALAEEGPRPSFVGRFIRTKVTKVLMRGSPENPRQVVLPAGPEILDGGLDLNSQSKGKQRRLKFAQWIADKENPLTARVMANRIWHHIFGTGIVSTTSDFGKAGAKPTHPQLLDWLAAELVSPSHETQARSPKAWSIKHLIRLIVMSHAFRQSSAPHSAGMTKNANSTLLWRFPPRRVEAEVIRDSILQASGVLDRKIGGKGFRIHNIKKTYAQWEVVNNHGPATWRRMLYQERMRRVDDKLFTAFDFPDCGQVRAKRPVSTTPLQALNLMNSPFVLDQSKRIAERARVESKEDLPQSVIRCFELILGRRPSEAEHSVCLRTAKESGLPIVCRALINSNEFAFLP